MVTKLDKTHIIVGKSSVRFARYYAKGFKILAHVYAYGCCGY